MRRKREMCESFFSDVLFVFKLRFAPNFETQFRGRQHGIWKLGFKFVRILYHFRDFDRKFSDDRLIIFLYKKF